VSAALWGLVGFVVFCVLSIVFWLCTFRLLDGWLDAYDDEIRRERERLKGEGEVTFLSIALYIVLGVACLHFGGWTALAAFWTGAILTAVYVTKLVVRREEK
jgi:membrane protein implicated in regulation of membrane protease activity